MQRPFFRRRCGCWSWLQNAEEKINDPASSLQLRAAIPVLYLSIVIIIVIIIVIKNNDILEAVYSAYYSIVQMPD